MQQRCKIRAFFYRHLEPNQFKNGQISYVNIILIALIILSVIVQVIQTDKVIFKKYWLEFIYLDVAFAIIFFTENTLRIWCYTEHPKYAGIRGRWRYICSSHSIIDIISLLPYFFTIGQDSWLCGAFRIIRLLSLSKYKNIVYSLVVLMNSIIKRRYELFLTILIFFMLILLSASLLYFAEHEVQPNKFGSIAASLWWSIVTLTTVGYGDIYPITDAGKCFAALTMLFGIGAFAMPTGILAASFSHAFQEKFEEKVINDLKTERKFLEEINEELEKDTKLLNKVRVMLKNKKNY